MEWMNYLPLVWFLKHPAVFLGLTLLCFGIWAFHEDEKESREQEKKYREAKAELEVPVEQRIEQQFHQLTSGQLRSTYKAVVDGAVYIFDNKDDALKMLQEAGREKEKQIREYQMWQSIYNDASHGAG